MLKMIGAGLVLGGTTGWEVANAFVKQQTASGTLHAMYDPRLSEYGHATFAWRTGARGGQCYGHPFVIGLGRKASAMLARMGAGELIGATNLAGPQLDADWLDAQLDSCAVAILVIDTTDPTAVNAAAYWARQFGLYQNIELRAALLLGHEDSPAARFLRVDMAYFHGVLRIDAGTADDDTQAAALLLDGWFQQDEAAIVIPVQHIREQLTQGRATARCRTIAWHGDSHRAMTQTMATWSDEQPGSMLAWLHATQDLSVDEFEQACAALSQYLAPSAPLGVSVIIRPDWAGTGRRAFSLVTTGRREWEAQAV
jgi:hypothetical protein